MAQELEGNDNNNCTGNYSIKCPIHPLRRFPSSFFSLSSLGPKEGLCVNMCVCVGGGQGAVWPECLMTRSSGWTHSDFSGSSGDCDQTPVGVLPMTQIVLFSLYTTVTVNHT